MQTFSRKQVAQHNSPDDCYIIIDDKVYDVTSFARFHPGGKGVIMAVAGQDATEVFFGLHRSSVLAKYEAKLLVGLLDEEGRKSVKPFVAAAPGELSVIPYAESYSPFQNESHRRLRVEVRKFLQEHVMPIVEDDDVTNAKPPPKELFRKLGESGIIPCCLGPGKHLTMGKYPLPAGIKPEEFDYFHELVVQEEFKRIGSYGYTDGLGGGLVIGLPPVLNFGSQELIQKIAPPVLNGEKNICLAISDPYAGSDVSNLQCSGVKSACGNYWIVNGVKKWITNGTFADYFVTAVRTGGAGALGISLMLIERGEGVETKRIKTSYTGAAGTAYVIFEDVKVPVGNLLGQENLGFKCIMANFNHERWAMAAAGNALNRLIMEECFKWASQRKVFGKPLINQPVIREKLAHMVAQVESVQAWVESITFQMCNMSYAEQTKKLAGPIALLKLQQTRVAQYVGDQAVQIFGGRALTRTGMGKLVERFQRTLKFGAILGGSEEILADLGVRQAMKGAPNARL